jgi:hypothetical protein
MSSRAIFGPGFPIIESSEDRFVDELVGFEPVTESSDDRCLSFRNRFISAACWRQNLRTVAADTLRSLLLNVEAIFS